MSRKQLRKAELAFDGALKTAQVGCKIRPNDFKVLTNIRYRDNGVRGIGGQSKINTTALNAGTAIKSAFQFIKDHPAESTIYAQCGDYVYKNTATVPGTGDFSATTLFTQTSGYGAAVWSKAPADACIMCNGVDTAIFAGNEMQVGAFVDLDEAGTDDYDYTDILNNTTNDSNNVATIHNTAGTTVLYIGSRLPLTAVHFYINTANTTTGTITASFWGASGWSTTGMGVTRYNSAGTELVDGIPFSNATYEKWSFSPDITSAKIRTHKGKYLYYYKFSVTNVDATTKLYRCTVGAPMQQIKDIWDGTKGIITAAVYKNGSGTYKDFFFNLYQATYSSSDATTYAVFDVGGNGQWGTSGDLVIGSPVKLQGVWIDVVQDYKNQATAALSVKYYNGSDVPTAAGAWTALTGTVDGTSIGGVTLNTSGYYSWVPPADNLEFKTLYLAGDRPANAQQVFDSPQPGSDMYYYKFETNATLTDAVRLFYIATVPAPENLDNWKGAVNHINRLWLFNAFNREPNAVLCSASETSQVFNGSDTQKYQIGGPEGIVAGTSVYTRYGSGAYSTLVLCKKGETWALTGETLDTISKYRVSDSIGCIAPKTMVASGIGRSVDQDQTNMWVGARNYALWLSAQGPVLFDGSAVQLIGQDISDLFDPEHANYLTDDVISTAQAFIDAKRSEYHLCFSDGTEVVYDMPRKKWYNVARNGAEITGGLPIQESNGENHIYGYDDAGFLYRLENGTTFSGNNIVCTLQTADIALDENYVSEETAVVGIKLFQVSKNTTANSVAITHYGDLLTSGTSLTAVSPANASGAITQTTRMQFLGPHNFHGFKFALTTDDESAPPFEPLFATILWKYAREDVR